MRARGRNLRHVSPTIALLLLAVVMAMLSNKAWSSEENRTTAPGACRYSDQVYESDASLMQRRVPTRLNLMASRYAAIVQSARGYTCSGTAGVAFNGRNYIQAGRTDDPGIAELIPVISSVLGLSLADTFDVTSLAVICAGILIGYAGFWRLFPNQRVRLAGIAIFLCLAIAELKVADVYIFQTSPLIAGIPWILYFGLSERPIALNASAALLAFSCSWCSLVRIGTTLICMAFLITVFVGLRRLQRIAIPLLLILLACAPPMFFEKRLLARRDAFLSSAGETATAVNIHPVWHSIYTGLAFVPNPEVPAFSDSIAFEKVRSIDPTAVYTSPEYEAILRREVLRIARHKPMLVIENLAAKSAIVLLLGSILLFPSGRLLFAEQKARWLDAAFALAIGLSAMNVILVAPKLPYLLTFLCLTFLYSSIKLCRAAVDSTTVVQS